MRHSLNLLGSDTLPLPLFLFQFHLFSLKTPQKLLLILIGPTEYSDVIRGTAATVLARVLLQNTPFFTQMMTSDAARAALQQQSAAKGGLSPLLLFVDTWLDKVSAW